MQLMSTLKAGAVVAALTFATQAGAMPLNGSVAIGGAANETGADLMSRTSFTITNASVTNTAGDFNGRVSDGISVNIGTFSTSAPVAFTVRSATTGQFGTFTAASFMQVTRRADFFSGIFTGTFTPDVPGAVSAYDGGPASFRISLNRSTFSTGASVSFAGTLALPPETVPAVPEPASMALLGVGLLGLGMVQRRKTN